MKKTLYILSVSAFALFNFAAVASVKEEHESQINTSPKTLEELDAFIKQNQKKHLNKIYSSGEILINLASTDPILGAKVLRNTKTGILHTEYTIPDNHTFKLIEVMGQIAPLVESIKRPRLERLAGDGYAKETSKGAVLATLNLKKGTPIAPGIFSLPLMSLSEDYNRELSMKQKGRKPINARDKIPHPQKTQTAYKPTAEDMENIKKNKEQEYRTKVGNWTTRFKNIALQDIEGEETNALVKTITFSLGLSDNNIGKNDLMVDQCLKSLEKSIVRLEQIQAERRKSQSLEVHNDLFSSLPSLDPSLGTIKKLALEKIETNEKKEKLKQERPNANSNPITSESLDKELKAEDVSTLDKAKPYIFENQVSHSIITVLKETTNADSSYAGITISRAELENFVKELENLERNERLASSPELAEGREGLLGYSYKKSEGKGSHAKVKFGKGTKPLILSKQGEHKLTIPQLRDLKEILIAKGLIPPSIEE